MTANPNPDRTGRLATTALAGLDTGASAQRTVLRIEGLKTHFHTAEGIVKAVDGVALTVSAGKTMCVVGESGCGKSITARSILGLVDPPGRVESGQIWWQPDLTAEPVDLAALEPEGPELGRVRGGQIGMVFQEPMASLSPMYSIGDQLIETLRLHQVLTPTEAREKAVDQLARVGIPQPRQRIDAYPFQLSGGMNQRAMIAIALCNDPALLIADEPTTALDVTTQARILDLLAQLQDETGMAIMFITHDLGVVAEIADDVTVMYLGTVAERGPVTSIFENPQHPYTQALLKSIPTVGQTRGSRLAAISGMVPHPNNRPSGCPFHTRCPSAIPGLCDTTPPAEHHLAPGRTATCHLHDPSLELPEASTPASAEPSGPASATTPAAAAAADRPIPSDNGETPLLSVRGLQMLFPVTTGFLSRTTGHVRAVDQVDLDIHPGETLGLVGESGCGKTTLGRCIARAIDPTAGTINYHDPDTGQPVNLAALSNRDLRPYRAQIRVIFQDPFTSLNPRKTLLQIIAEPLKRTRGNPIDPSTVDTRNGGSTEDSSIQDRVAAMLRRVGLRPEYMRRYPHAFSGGERQRINIARALITHPRLVIADEAVSALDVSVRAQILNLLRDLQDEYQLTYLFISHDLSVVEYLCDRVAVMYLGKIVERSNTSLLYTQPRHPYTEALLSAVPLPDPRLRDTSRRIRLADDLPDPANPPAGCYFHTRCSYNDTARCMTQSPELRLINSDPHPHTAACHHTETLDLVGVRQTSGPESPDTILEA